MPSRNVEIKARVVDSKKLFVLASKLCEGQEPKILIQHDIFFNSPNGRLKLREFCGLGDVGTPSVKQEAELIFYDRPDTEGPKLSSFVRTTTSDPEGLKEALKMSMGIKAELHKHRTLFIYEQARIHLDEVRDLGDFMELEVCLRDDQTVEDGQKIAEDIMEKLEISKESLMSGAYVDSLNK